MVLHGAHAERLRRLLRAPVVHFLLAGGLLFALAPGPGGARHMPAAGAAREPITFTAQALERLRSDWTERFGTPPSPQEERSLLARAVDEEILFREALALGFDRNKVVRGRLVQIGGFLGLAPEEDEPSLDREARSLDLTRSDPVVRRHLVEMMRVALEKPRRSDLPSESELARYYERTSAHWARPARVRLTHVYLAADQHRAALDTDAADLLDELRRGGVSPAEALSAGDPFPRGNGPILASRADLDRAFGAGFFDAVSGLDTGTWAGPVRSSYGLHLVWIHDRLPARLRPLASVRSQVLLDYLNERGTERLQATLQALRAAYPVEIERRG
jgi:peptidyl-prolyl cis-trans isomerase C